MPEAGFEVTKLPGRGIQRRLTLQNLGAAAGLVVARRSPVWLIVARRRPRVVVTVGGYAGPALSRWQRSCCGCRSSS